MRLRVFITVLGAISALLGSTAAQAASVVTCGQVVTTGISLANDLTNCPGSGLIIGAEGITLDLNGHTIDGTGNGFGILSAGHDAVTIRHGVVRDFATGIHVRAAGHGTVSNLESSANRLAGIDLRGVHHTLVAGNRVSANSSGVLTLLADENVIMDNIATGNGTGFFLTFSSDRNALIGNLASASGLHGFFVGATGGSPLSQGNTLSANVASGSGFDGIVIFDPLNTLRANVATDNRNLGVFAVPGTIDGGGNRASGNGNPAQCFGVSCASGER